MVTARIAAKNVRIGIGRSPSLSAPLWSFPIGRGRMRVWPAMDYAHDLSDVPPELLFALHQSGCCLSALEDALMEDDVIYDK